MPQLHYLKATASRFLIQTLKFGILTIFALGLILLFSNSLPLKEIEFPESTKIYDRHGVLLYEYYGEVRRTPASLRDIATKLQQATIAAEDRSFYEHSGIYIPSMVRAGIANVEARGIVQGASTITQQLVRNTMLTREKSFERKIREILLALRLEQHYSKDQILEMYLNFTPYGPNIYGVTAASESFFQKNPSELTLMESAYLAALPKAPSAYSPYGPNRSELDSRARQVLSAMQQEGYITPEEKQTAENEAVQFKKNPVQIKAPHFVMYILDLLAHEYGEEALRENGLRVTTSLDLSLQTLAEEVIRKQVPINNQNYRGSNASLVALDPKTGQILAMVGSKDYWDEKLDGAVNVALRPRQPGSSFKPYVYASAFQQGFNPATMIVDVATNFGRYGRKDYIPQNYDGRQRGPISIRQALQGSLNIPAVKTLMLTGIDQAIDTAESLGITTLKDRSRLGPSLVLGGAEVTLLEHTAAFGVFATNGSKAGPTPILQIHDSSGKVLSDFTQEQAKIVLDPPVAYQIANILSDNEARMYIFSNRKNILTLPDRPVAAKTGTTQQFRDAWTVGFTPSLVTGVWVGNNDNTPMRYGADGLVVAAPIWNQFMRQALEGTPPEQFPRPEGIIELAVDSLSGKLPSQYSPQTKKEIFTIYNQPTTHDDVHQVRYVGDASTVVTVLHSEKPDNPSWENPVIAWSERAGYMNKYNELVLAQETPKFIFDPALVWPDEVSSTLDWEWGGFVNESY